MNTCTLNTRKWHWVVEAPASIVTHFLHWGHAHSNKVTPSNVSLPVSLWGPVTFNMPHWGDRDEMSGYWLCVVLRIRPRTPHTLGKHSVYWTTPQPHPSLLWVVCMCMDWSMCSFVPYSFLICIHNEAMHHLSRTLLRRAEALLH